MYCTLCFVSVDLRAGIMKRTYSQILELLKSRKRRGQLALTELDTRVKELNSRHNGELLAR